MATAVVGGLFLFFRFVVFDTVVLTSGVMLPNLTPASTLVIARWSEPEPGDVVVFRAGGVAHVARIVATGGQRVRMIDNRVMVDGRGLSDGGNEDAHCQLDADCDCECTLRTEQLGANSWSAQTLGPGVLCQCLGRKGEFMRVNDPVWPVSGEAFLVPNGHVFVMSDNRDMAVDSRELGPIPVEGVIGPVVGSF